MLTHIHTLFVVGNGRNNPQVSPNYDVAIPERYHVQRRI